MGLFSFNLSNSKNTPKERFFETVGTNVKTVFTGASGKVESKASVTGGSVTNSGELKLDLETPNGVVTLIFGTDAVPVKEQEYDQATGNETAGKAIIDPHWQNAGKQESQKAGKTRHTFAVKHADGKPFHSPADCRSLRKHSADFSGHQSAVRLHRF